MERDPEASFREGVSKRYAVLASLVEEGKSKRALTEALPQSRSTINRAIRELQAMDCVTSAEAGGTYRATQAGRLAFEYEQAFRERMAGVSENTALVNSVPTDAPLAAEFVAGMEAHFSPRAPDVAFQPGTELVEQADRMRGTATVVRRQYFDVLGEQLERDDFELELVLEADLVDVIRRNYAEEFASLADASNVALFESEASIPYALWITDGAEGATSGITLHTNGAVKGSMVNSSPAAVEWAESQYEQYRANATRIV